MTEDLAEETGIHMGDGSMGIYSGKGLYQLRGHLIDDRYHYETFICSLYKRIYNLDVSLRDMPSTGVLGFQVWNDDLVSFKHSFIGLPLGKKVNMSLPPLINSKKLFFAFMRGYFDTDGSIHIENKRGKPYPRIDIKTTSLPLANEIVENLTKFGITASLYTYVRPEKNWNDLHSIIIRGFPRVLSWIKLINSHNKKHLDKFDTVVSIYSKN